MAYDNVNRLHLFKIIRSFHIYLFIYINIYTYMCTYLNRYYLKIVHSFCLSALESSLGWFLRT